MLLLHIDYFDTKTQNDIYVQGKNMIQYYEIMAMIEQE